jgi:hypothetical protein
MPPPAPGAPRPRQRAAQAARAQQHASHHHREAGLPPPLIGPDRRRPSHRRDKARQQRDRQTNHEFSAPPSPLRAPAPTPSRSPAHPTRTPHPRSSPARQAIPGYTTSVCAAINATVTTIPNTSGGDVRINSHSARLRIAQQAYPGLATTPVRGTGTATVRGHSRTFFAERSLLSRRPGSVGRVGRALPVAGRDSSERVDHWPILARAVDEVEVADDAGLPQGDTGDLRG